MPYQPGQHQPGPEPQQPGAMQPTTERQAPAGHQPRLTERRAAQAGDLICGQCGEANPPVRKFCARCGSGLVEARVVAEKWWRRIFPKREPAKAGTRHRRRGSAGRAIGRVVRWVLAILLLAGIGAYGLISPFRQAVNGQAVSAANTVRNWFSEQVLPVRPSQVTASASIADHGPDLVADNAKNTYWAAPAQPLPALVFTFEAPVTLNEAIFQIGIGEDFQTALRPHQLHLVYSTGGTFDLSLADEPGPQTVKVQNAGGVQRVEMYIVSTYPSLQGTDVAISEIEFFTVE
ncbi:zinc ribbon domain-containing protein [Actinosynnema sp. NPDC047251]|uniref:zinc ribbon domain-containing protein n=1 Tax=Saccharothrix espanaensis TaxID=103731 RepID=UPI0002EE7227|nr:zinc ribbon domain-containing protein [Saccharothrix espanaensis]